MKVEHKKITMATIIISLTFLSLLYMVSNKSDDYEVTMPEISQEEIAPELVEEVEEVEEIEGVIQVVEVPRQVPIYICGEVNRPDVYYLDETAIIKEAIMVAGGFTEAADQEAWNLAIQIQKGEKIYVPKVGEQIDKTDDSYDNRVRDNDTPSETADESTNISNGLININKANASQLSTLPGIGPTISQSIIDYRDANGEFKTLQDVTNVSRIGPKTLEKIKNHICLK